MGGRDRDRDRGHDRPPRSEEDFALPKDYTPIVLPGESISKFVTNRVPQQAPMLRMLLLKPSLRGSPPSRPMNWRARRRLSSPAPDPSLKLQRQSSPTAAPRTQALQSKLPDQHQKSRLRITPVCLSRCQRHQAASRLQRCSRSRSDS